MKILAIDTATKFLSLGIYDDGRIYEYNLEVERKLSSLLAVTIKRILDTLDLEVSDLDYLACGLGRGSFTGMRVGLSTMKGLGWAGHKPLIGISSLDILAMNAVGENKMIIPAIDAKRNMIYCAFYKNTASGIKKVSSYMLITKDELFKRIQPGSVIFGDALNLYRDDIIKNFSGVTLLDKDQWYPKGHNIIGLALKRIKAKKIDDLFTVKPIYIYPKECQIKSEISYKLRVAKG